MITMPAEVANGVTEAASLPNGDLKSQNPSGAAKKSRELERRRRRRKQKKNKQNATADDDTDTVAEDPNGTVDESSKENSDPQKVKVQTWVDGVEDEEFVGVWGSIWNHNSVEGEKCESNSPHSIRLSGLLQSSKEEDCWRGFNGGSRPLQIHIQG